FDHVHEREVGRQLGRPVRFVPHVAEFFRGILMTVNVTLDRDLDAAEAIAATYAHEPLVHVTDEAPWVAHSVGRHGVTVGGVAQRGREVTVYATLDNLLKGAATQALQNLNLACGFDELEGIPVE
ncbi:MAG: Asd/ArgC dimerization domain-containing protein, partial [Pseudomonadota bacterium]